MHKSLPFYNGKEADMTDITWEIHLYVCCNKITIERLLH